MLARSASGVLGGLGTAMLAHKLVADQSSPPLHVSVSRVIPADPLTVYDALSDISTIGQRSPETRTAKWIELVTVVRGPITALATDA